MKSFIENFLIILVITIILIEILPYFSASYIIGTDFSRSQFSIELTGNKVDSLGKTLASEKKNTSEYLGNHILHPYLGFVSTPSVDYNRFCFPGPDPITKIKSNNFNICITGGSVAQQMFQNSKEHIVKTLKKDDFFKEKDINIVLLALDGFKQPQQMLALNYFLSLGAEYDLVVNLDGFHDIVLPFTDNLPYHVSPSYPRHWNIYSRKRLDSRVQEILMQKRIIQSNQELWQDIFATSFLKHSNMGLMIWKSIDRKNKTALYENELKLKGAMDSAEYNYQSVGPAFSFIDTAAFLLDQANLWMRSSLQMGSLAREMEFEYLHFLQPNQYCFDSKVFTEEELLTAFVPGTSKYKKGVSLGYPFLREKGFQLTQNDINFYDLTLIFKKEKRTVYSDKCCHFNQLGYDIIADNICDRILKAAN